MLTIIITVPDEKEPRTVNVAMKLCARCHMPFVPAKPEHRFCLYRGKKCKDEWYNEQKKLSCLDLNTQ